MSDLVKRLRALSRHEHDDLSLGDEAADEIDRLQALWDKRGRFSVMDGCCCAFPDGADVPAKLCMAHKDMIDAAVAAERERCADEIESLTAERDAAICENWEIVGAVERLKQEIVAMADAIRKEDKP